MQGLIPQAFIDELIRRTDIVDLIDGYVPLKKRGTNYLACCPFHNEKTPSFNVSPKQQFYHCFGCQASGNVISFVMQYLNQSFPESIETLASRAGMHVPRDTHTPKEDTRDLYQLLERVTRFYQSKLKTDQPAIDYLKKRGMAPHIAKLYQIGYAPSAWQTLEYVFPQEIKALVKTGMLIQKDDQRTYDRYRHRIIFPIHDRHGKIIGFGGRALGEDQQPKYLNSPETLLFQKGREVYGLYQALQHEKQPSSLIVVEGYMDTIALAQHGIANVVATLGTATTTFHIQLLSKYTQQLYFCFDGDTAGQKAAWRALESSLPYMNSGLDAKFIFLPDNKDPDDLIREEGKDLFLQRLDSAKPLNQFFYETLLKDIDQHHFSGKSQLVQTAKPFLLKIGEGPYLQLMIAELTRLTRIDEHRLTQMIYENTTPPTELVKSTSLKRSPLRIALAIVLQHPEIYLECSQTIQPTMLDPQKQELLCKLMQHIIDHPSITTALLIEHWRDTAWFDTLNKLASWDHNVPQPSLAKEFMDTIHFLNKQNREIKIQALLSKSRQQPLNAEERETLQELLKERHG